MTTELELCTGTVRQAGLIELIDVAGRAGFSAITTNPTHYAQAGVDDSTLRAMMADAGVRVTNIDGMGSVLPGIPVGAAIEPYRDFHGRDVRRTFTTPEDDFYRTAHALGGDSVNLVHFAGDPNTDEAALVDRIGEVTERAAAQGLRIALEFLPGTGIPDFATAAGCVRAVGASNLGITLDCRHLVRSGGHATEVAADADLVGLLQMDDLFIDAPDGPERLLPGDGDLPLVDILSPVRRAHPELPVGVEVFNADLYAMTSIDAATAAAASLRALLAACDDQ
jgi:sugar phosphate isomerase/epimerase